MSGRTKHNPPKEKKPSFIKFGKVQVSYLNEVRNRQIRELNDALESVYQELGLIEKITQAPRGTYILRQDYSGLDVNVIPKVDVKPKDEKKTEEPQKEAEPAVVAEGKGSKDN